MGDWLETYRGTVFRWEVDGNDHFTVAYYFARIADAGAELLADLGLGPDETRTIDCFVRYQRELRVNDLMHVESGVIGAEPGALLLGHKLIDSGAGALCTTVEQRVRVPAALPAETARRVVGDVQIKFTFQCKQDIDSVERIDLQLFEALVDGRGFRRNLLGAGDYAGHAGYKVLWHQFCGHRI